MTTVNVAVMFTDMAGSTALAAGLTPDAADDVRRGHFSILRQAVAEASGTEVKNLGDGLMVVFATASAAMSCAVAMQQGVDRDNRSHRSSVGLRVGLSGGEVTTEDDDYFGDPVVEAARLCATGEGGRILVADVVRAMAGRRSSHQYRVLGPLALKGLSEPVETVELLWEPLTGPGVGGVPLPARLGLVPGVGVVGRATELAAVGAAVKRVSGGDGQREILLISGEAGLGKTTLVAAAARAAFEDGACVVFGHCEEDLSAPYRLLAESLTHYVTHVSEDRLEAHVAAHGSELVRMVPALASRIRDLPPSKATDPDTERYLLFAAVVGLLSQASQDQPVVLVLDDLQWADAVSLELLRHLAATEQPLRLLVLGAYRDTELTHGHPLLATLAWLRRLPGVTRMPLSGLDDRGVVSFMEAAAGHVLDDSQVGLAHAVYSETDGNPFFVGEVLRHLVDTGAIYQDANGRWVAHAELEGLGLPESVREVLTARVARLGPAAGRVLSLAAVIGRDFDFELLARASDTSEEELLDVLDSATAAALVREMSGMPGRFNFAHALIQHTLYQDLGSTRRARAHRQVAEALEDLCGDRPGSRVGELARHWFNATQVHDLGKALGYSQRAADDALAALAPGDALRYYAQALDLLAQVDEPDLVQGVDLAIGLGTAQRQTGDPAFRETLLDAARRAAALDDPPRMAVAALANNRGNFSATGTVDEERLQTLEAALARSTDPVTKARLFATACIEKYFMASYDERLAMLRTAKELAPRDDPATFVSVYNLVVEVVRHPAQLAERLDDTALLLALAEDLDDPAAQLWAVGHRMRATFEAGTVEESDRLFARMQTLATDIGQPALLWQARYTLAQRTLLHGDHAEGERLATAAFELASQSGEPDALAYYLAQMDQVLWLQGRGGEVADSLQQGLIENPGLPTFGAALARALVQGERWDEAATLLATAAAERFTRLRADLLWATGMAMYAEAAIQLDDRMAAGILFEELVPYRDQIAFTGASCDGALAHYLGALATVLGHYDEADQFFDAADRWNERARAPFMASRTQLERGRMLLRRGGPGDGDRAAVLLDDARGTAEARGFAGVSRQAAGLRE